MGSARFPETSIMRQFQRVLEVSREYFEMDVAAGQPLQSGIRFSGAHIVPVRVARRRSPPHGHDRALERATESSRADASARGDPA